MQNQEVPQRRLSTFDLICLVFGTVVGAGIFKAPSIVAAQSGSGLEFLLAWLIGGLISVAGALCYAELSTSEPQFWEKPGLLLCVGSRHRDCDRLNGHFGNYIG